MKAPTEKHLEDWIVDHNAYELDEGYHQDMFGAIVARQFRLPYGIADLITQRCESVTVIEIKQGVIDEKVLTQCARYMRQLRQIYYWVFCEAMMTDNPDHQQYRFTPLHTPEVEPYFHAEINGVVIGSHISHAYIPLIATHMSIDVFSYDYDQQDDWYVFDHQLEDMNKLLYEDCQEYGKGILGEAMRTAIKKRAERMNYRGMYD